MASGKSSKGRSGSTVFEVECPCCGATLTIDPELKTILDHKEKPKPKTLEDITAGVARLKEAEAERQRAFDKSFEAVKTQKDVLSRRFDELLKKAKEDPDDAPPVKPFDLD